MTLDEYFDQYINKQLTHKLGTDYAKINNNIDTLNKTNRGYNEEIENLKLNVKKCFEGCKTLQDAINKKINEFDAKINKIEILETFIKKVNDSQGQFGQQINNKIAILENKNTSIMQYCKRLEEINNNNVRNILILEEENRKLSQIISEKETKNNKHHSSHSTNISNELFSQNEKIARGKNNTIIEKFNEWAANPISIIPVEFSYLAGDFSIRMNQQDLTETVEETKWIINRGGEKKYLLPNPNLFDPMTNISELYKMDLNLLKVKGRNKIKIITPCEISSSGFIEFAGELKIL